MSDQVKLALITALAPVLALVITNIFAMWKLYMATKSTVTQLQETSNAQRENREAIDKIAIKADVLQDALNGRLTEFKRDSAKYAQSLSKMSDLVMQKANSLTAERTAGLSATILLLQAKLEVVEQMLRTSPGDPAPQLPPAPPAAPGPEAPPPTIVQPS